MLPWFKAPTGAVLSGMMRHTWSQEAPAPEYVARLELLALDASGQRSDWSLSDLAGRWGWSKSRAHRLIRTWSPGPKERRSEVQPAGEDGTILGRSRDDPGTILGRSWDAGQDSAETQAEQPDQRSQEPTSDPGTILGRSWDDSGTILGSTWDDPGTPHARPLLDRDQDQDQDLPLSSLPSSAPAEASSAPAEASGRSGEERPILSITSQRTADRLIAHGIRTLDDLRALSWSRARVIAYGSGGAPAVGSDNLIALLQRAGLDIQALEQLPGAPRAAAALGDEEAEASWRLVWSAICGGARPDQQTRAAIETYLGPLDELGRLPEREARALRDRWIPLYPRLRERGELSGGLH